MSDSLVTAVSGLEAAQQMLDVTGNNLANVNFEDVYYQTLQPASEGGTATSLGGTNPIQIGGGVQVASINTDLSQGTFNQTGNPLDLAIQGNGMFVVNNGIQDLYTRAGAFAINSSNVLIDSATGDPVQRTGSVGESSGTNAGFQVAGNDNINVPLGSGIPAEATSTFDLEGNLDASADGPLAQTLTTAEPFTTSGAVAATSTTLLDDLSSNTAAYKSGDEIDITGTDANGTAVSTTFDPFANPTLCDLVSAINSAFPGATASLDANGNIVVQSNTAGPSTLNVTLADAAGNVGGSGFGNNALNTTVEGAAGTTATTSVQVYDIQGTPLTLSVTLQKQANNDWNMTATIPSNDRTMLNGTVNGIEFNSNGSLAQVNGVATGTAPISFQVNGLSTPQTINVSFGSLGGFGGLTQFDGTSAATAVQPNGYAAGTLTSVVVDQTGTISGVYTNGQTVPLAQLAMASFTNPAGLNQVGNNYYSASAASGSPTIGTASTGTVGSISSGTLEASNVEITSQFTQLITAQQAYEVNSRVLTIASELMQELANIIH
jgi:flagellar hook protein FlgE